MFGNKKRKTKQTEPKNTKVFWAQKKIYLVGLSSRV
jgi:hypothetical protein